MKLQIIAAALLASLSASAQKTHVTVRDHNWDSVHTYRIPALETSKNGVLLAVYDVRRDSGRDLQGDIDIGLSRSTDGGATWLPMQIVLDMGTWGGLPQKFNGVSDACLLTDQNTGRIWVAGLWMYGVLDLGGKWTEGLTEQSDNWTHQWRDRGSQSGLSPKETSQFLMAYSDDDGTTWSDPINMTEQLKKPEWWIFAPAPGRGITMTDGTLVMPSDGRDSVGETFSNIMYSRDGGATWTVSAAAAKNTTECAVVELSDGSLMLNMRDNRNGDIKGEGNGRAVFVTRDMGQTWTEHPTSRKALIEPVCMGSLHRHVTRDGEAILLFSNPASTTERSNMRLRASTDDGKTWNSGVLINAGNSAGYSCITSIDPETIGILYEGTAAQMEFKAVSVDEILSAK